MMKPKPMQIYPRSRCYKVGPHVVASRAVGERRPPLWGLVVLGLIGAIAGLQLSAASGAPSPSTLLEQANALRSDNAALTGEERATWFRQAVRMYPGYVVYQRRAGNRRIPVLRLDPV